jgi:hypothetical protein
MRMFWFVKEDLDSNAPFVSFVRSMSLFQEIKSWEYSKLELLHGLNASFFTDHKLWPLDRVPSST